jgi:type IV pilus assembly protein PilB
MVDDDVSSQEHDTDVAPSGRISNTKAGDLPFGELLVSKGLISHQDLMQALDEQRQHGGRLGEILLQLEKILETDLIKVLSEYLDIEHVQLRYITDIDVAVARSLPENITKRFNLLPIGEYAGKVTIVMADPLDVVAIDTVVRKMKRQIKPVLGLRSEIRHMIEQVFHGSDVDEEQLRNLIEYEDSTEEEQESVIFDGSFDTDDIGGEDQANEAPVIKFVDILLRQAVKTRASDIHIEPQEKSTVIRTRIDGKLRNMVPPPNKMRAAVVARIKILAQMDIAERRLPQDGRLKIRVARRDIDVRVNTIPTIYGEKVVMRILDAASASHDIERLGLEASELDELKGMLQRPHGIIIVTGPTGSGKSTTLYAALNYLRDPTKNITTVEDPVEYRLAGINQIQIKPEIDLDFAASLRAILRQDPDIILIGEIRDQETVEIAIKASLTGHLVLSTFHTNDAPSAISRLAYMGTERYLLASTLNLVIAQRLVRRICEHCKEPATLSDEMIQRLHISPDQMAQANICHGKGCVSCGGTGYAGRCAIFEFLVVDHEIGELIIHGQNEMDIRAAARQKGYGGLMESGVRKMLQGITTSEEVIHVAFMGNKH